MVENTHEPVARETERGIRYAILTVFVVGLRRRNPGAVVNALVAFVATYLPDAIEHRYDVGVGPWQRVYSDAAMLIHTVGMLGPYDDVWWWDHLTHTHSATLLGGLVFVTARRHGRDPRPRVLAAVVGLGVLWELMEYTIHAIADRLDCEPILVSYGRSDILLDLLFDLFGALLVLAFGDRFLRNLYRHAD